MQTGFHLQFDVTYFLNFVFNPSPGLIGGLAITIYVSIIAQAVGVVLGVFSGLAGMAKNSVLRNVSRGYVWLFRGTPLLVQLFLVYYGTPYILGIDLFPTDMNFGALLLHGGVVAGIVALSLNEGAFMSEIVRAGIIAVDPGQTEAAKSLGMTYGITMRRIVVPQALRVIIPPLGNEFNGMLKMTSLLSVLGVSEAFRVAEAANAATFKSFESYLGIALYYLALTTIWGWIQGRIEARMSKGQAGASTGSRSLRERMFGVRGLVDPSLVSGGR